MVEHGLACHCRSNASFIWGRFMAYTECYKLTPWTCVGSNIHQKANRHQSAKLLHVPSIASRDMYMGVMHVVTLMIRDKGMRLLQWQVCSCFLCHGLTKAWEPQQLHPLIDITMASGGKATCSWYCIQHAHASHNKTWSWLYGQVRWQCNEWWTLIMQHHVALLRSRQLPNTHRVPLPSARLHPTFSSCYCITWPSCLGVHEWWPYLWLCWTLQRCGTPLHWL